MLQINQQNKTQIYQGFFWLFSDNIRCFLTTCGWSWIRNPSIHFCMSCVPVPIGHCACFWSTSRMTSRVEWCHPQLGTSGSSRRVLMPEQLLLVFPGNVPSRLPHPGLSGSGVALSGPPVETLGWQSPWRRLRQHQPLSVPFATPLQAPAINKLVFHVSNFHC